MWHLLGANECLMSKYLQLISEHLTFICLQVHGGGPHCVLDALKC